MLPNLDSLFSDVSIEIDNGKKMYSASQACAIINYNLNAAVNLIDSAEKKKIEVERNQFLWYFSEKGIYQLVFLIQKTSTTPFKTLAFGILESVSTLGWSIREDITLEELQTAKEAIDNLIVTLTPPESPETEGEQ